MKDHKCEQVSKDSSGNGVKKKNKSKPYVSLARFFIEKISWNSCIHTKDKDIIVPILLHAILHKPRASRVKVKVQ